MANRKRPIVLRCPVKAEERKLIEQKMAQIPTKRIGAYLRKMAIDGYIIYTDTTDIKEMNQILGAISRNINQIAKRINYSGNIYQEDMKEMRTIMSIPDFNGSNMSWEFYLVGNKFSANGYIEGEINTNKGHGEPHLVYKSDRYKIYVMLWSEVFAAFEMRHAYLSEKLEIERSKLQKNYTGAEEVINDQETNTASMPGEMASTR